jgi:hypothetical protein
MSLRALVVLSSLGLVSGLLSGCADGSDTTAPEPAPPPPPKPALVHVSMDSEVGALLEEFPQDDHQRIAEALIAMPEDWWIERARWQLRLTSIRLVYRKYYFEEAEQESKNALPLPPESAWNITLAGTPTRTTVNGHPIVKVDYHFEGMLVTDEASPGISEPALAKVGGVWDEPFVFPVDPTLLLQRTGYACISEDQFPPDSVDAEEAYRFYDDTCQAEVSGQELCHYSLPLPTQSCEVALRDKVGSVKADLHFERVAYDPLLGDAARTAAPTFTDSPDLEVLTEGEGLNDNRVIYKYIPEGSCAVVEQCVGGSGWRRLLVFDSHDHNVGGQPIHIGPVDYANEGLGGELIDHNVYEFSECHEHYHFAHYGDFTFGSQSTTATHKNGFCLESTDRLSNHEYSPLHTTYECDNQGVDAGWGDLYGSSLPCNWIDVTDIDTSGGAVSGDLTFHSNPDGFICEGELLRDDQGNQIWEPTEFMSAEGAPVDRPACKQKEGTEGNDTGSVSVTLEDVGGFITSPCRSDQDLGPLRNCDFEPKGAIGTCTPGDTVVLDCTNSDSTKAQVVRVCEASTVLGEGMECAHREALVNEVLDSSGTAVTFTCPAARDDGEPGGSYAIYSAPAWLPDGVTDVVCVESGT